MLKLPLASLGGCVCMSVLAAGCTCPVITEGTIPQPANTLSVYQLSGLLHMRLESSSGTVATLSDGRNRLTIFANPNGQVVINGKPVGTYGEVQSIEDVLFVPRSVEPQIVAEMRGLPEEWPPAQPPVEPKPPAPPITGSATVAHGTVVLDPGHGAHDPGTHSLFSGLTEKAVNIHVALAVREILQRRGVNVVMTRSDDTFVELEDRAALANRKKADLFVSLHSNSNPNCAICGYEIFVAPGASGKSVSAATAVSRRLAEVTHSYGDQPHTARYRVLVLNERPAMLVEMGFLSNRMEAGRMGSSDYQQRLAAAIADGIIDYLRRG